jgi:hypothetical protein
MLKVCTENKHLKISVALSAVTKSYASSNFKVHEKIVPRSGYNLYP